MSETLFDTVAESRSAHLSECGTYRYTLTRRWSDAPLLGWVMLNPSTADASIDDPTIRRCVGFARAWAFGGIHVVNLFALRSTDPAALATHPAPIGPENDEHIVRAAMTCPRVIAAWGCHGTRGGRDAAVRRLLTSGRVTAQWSGCPPLACLGTTKDGHPRHPLRVRGDALPTQYP